MQQVILAQLALPLGRFLGQDMTPVRGIALEQSGRCAREALRGTAVGLDFGHFSLRSVLAADPVGSLLDAAHRKPGPSTAYWDHG
jgi:hypothetical protein